MVYKIETAHPRSGRLQRDVKLVTLCVDYRNRSFERKMNENQFMVYSIEF